MLRVTDMMSTPSAGRFYWGPYNGAFSERAGYRIFPFIWYPGILIPDSIPRACLGVEHSFRGLRTSDRG
jgi:hypothetical protein